MPQSVAVMICEKLLKEALYGIEPSTRNSKIWPTREEAALSVPKHILLNLNQTRTRATLLQSITDVSTTALSRITFKSHELKNSNNIYHAACLIVLSVVAVLSTARLRNIVNVNKIFLGTDGAASRGSAKLCHFAWKVQSHTVPL